MEEGWLAASSALPKTNTPSSFAAAAATAASASKSAADFDLKAARSAEHGDKKRRDDLIPIGTCGGTAGSGTVKSVRDTRLESKPGGLGKEAFLWLSVEEAEWIISPLPPQDASAEEEDGTCPSD